MFENTLDLTYFKTQLQDKIERSLFLVLSSRLSFISWILKKESKSERDGKYKKQNVQRFRLSL